MESVIIISIKLKYDHQTQCFKWNIDEGWNGRGVNAAPSKGKGNRSQVSGKNQYRVCVWCPTTSLPRTHKYQGRKQKKYDGGYSFGSAFLAPPNSGGVGGFFFGSSSYSSINGGTSPISGDKGSEEKEEETSSALAADFFFVTLAAATPAVIASAGAANNASGFSLGAAPSFSVMSLSN